MRTGQKWEETRWNDVDKTWKSILIYLVHPAASRAPNNMTTPPHSASNTPTPCDEARECEASEDDKPPTMAPDT